MKQRWMKAAAAGTTGAVIAAGLLVGVANARPGEQAPSPTPTPAAGQRGAGQNAQQREQRAQEFVNRLAANLGVTPDKLRDALKQTALQEIDAAVAAGRMTAEQAQRAKEAINSGKLPHFGMMPGGHGPGGPGGRGGHGDRRGPDFGGAIRNQNQDIAQFLGITVDKLREEMRSGKSLADIAKANGKTVDQLKSFILSNAKAKLDQAVKDGKITQQMADRAYQQLQDHVDEMISHTPGQRPGRN